MCVCGGGGEELREVWRGRGKGEVEGGEVGKAIKRPTRGSAKGGR